MPIVLAFAIVSVAAIAITYKTYVGYGDYAWYTKTAFLLFLIIGWCAPFLGFALRHANTDNGYALLTKGLYFLFGFTFFLFVITFIRDIIWLVVDLIRRAPLEEMKTPPLLAKANVITFVCCLLFCFYGVYEAEKNAAVKNIDIYSPKIKQAVKVVMLSDLHIDTDVSVAYVKNLVSRVNGLDADAVVIVGDIIDNTPERLSKQMNELQQLKAKNGVYVTFGNHEFYASVRSWIFKFAAMRFSILNNFGQPLGESGLYLAGIPDTNAAASAGMPVRVDEAIKNAAPEAYVVLLSHSPKITEEFPKDKVDLMLSGHTHGGQIFPFHIFVKQANQGYLAGFYDVAEKMKLYISRGTRYWGPPLRIFAPSEITVFNFLPEKTDARAAD